jgi:hypothetical protein
MPATGGKLLPHRRTRAVRDALIVTLAVALLTVAYATTAATPAPSTTSDA